MKNEKEKEIWLNPEELQQLLEGGLYWKDIEPKVALENTDSFKRPLSIDSDSDDSNVAEETFLFTDYTADDEENVEELRTLLLGDRNAAKDEQQALFISQAASLEVDFPASGQDENIGPDVNGTYSVMSSEAEIQSETDIIEEDKTEIKTELMEWDSDSTYNPGSMSQESELIGEGIDHEDMENTLVMKSLADFVKIEETEVGKDERSSFSNLNNTNKKSEKQVEYGHQDSDDDDDDELEYREKSGFGGLIVVGLIVIVALITFGVWYFFL